MVVKTFKETIICIVIIVVIFSLDIFTQKYTKNTTNEITEIFSELKQLALREDKEQMEKEIVKLDDEWNKKHDKLAYYIEHDELEKVDTAIVSAKSYIETEDYPSALAELDVGKFVLEHIQRKYAFNLVNIF